MSTLALPRTLSTVRRPTAPPRTRTSTARPVTRWLWDQRSVGALFGLIGVTISTLIAVLIASLIGPFIMFVLPFILLMGFALGPLHAMLRGEL